MDHKNVSHIYEFVEMLSSIGVDSVKIGPKIVSNHGNLNNEYHASIFQVARQLIDKAAADFSGKKIELFDSYHLQYDTFEKRHSWCPFLQILPVLGADCRVYSCQDKAYNIDHGMLGSIKEKRFKDFWFDGKEKFFAVDPSVQCNHHCVADAKNKLILEYLDCDEDHIGFV